MGADYTAPPADGPASYDAPATAPPIYGPGESFADPVAAPEASAPGFAIDPEPEFGTQEPVVLTPAVDELAQPKSSYKSSGGNIESKTYLCEGCEHECCPPDEYWKRFFALYGTFFGSGTILLLVGIIMLAANQESARDSDEFGYFWAAFLIIVGGALCCCFGVCTLACQCGWDGDLCCCC